MKFNFKTIGTRVGGSAAGGGASFLTDKLLPNMNPKIRAGIKAVVGAVVPELFPKSKIVEFAGAGLIGAATDNLIKDFTSGGSSNEATSGIGEDQFSEDQFTVDQDFHQVTGNDEDITMSGVDVISGNDAEVVLE